MLLFVLNVNAMNNNSFDIGEVFVSKRESKFFKCYILKDHTPNPFADIKAKTRYKTLSNGLFDEMHYAVDSIQYYHALLNTKAKKIIKLLPVEENDEYKVDPVVFALSVDPMADKYPGISPYAYCAWNPIMLVDPDGRWIRVAKQGSSENVNTFKQMLSKSFNNKVNINVDDNGYLNIGMKKGQKLSEEQQKFYNFLNDKIKETNNGINTTLVDNNDPDRNFVLIDDFNLETIDLSDVKAFDGKEGNMFVGSVTHFFEEQWQKQVNGILTRDEAHPIATEVELDVSGFKRVNLITGTDNDKNCQYGIWSIYNRKGEKVNDQTFKADFNNNIISVDK